MSALGGKEGKMSVLVTESRAKKEIQISEVFVAC